MKASAKISCLSGLPSSKRGGNRFDAGVHARRLNDFISRLEVLDYGPRAAGLYDEIRADLERGGKIIGLNDLHIASHARSEGLTLVSNNFKEFN